MGVEPQAIKEALTLLDPTDDSHWTSDGMPRMDVIESIVEDKSIVRADVTNADPEFCREVALKLADTQALEEADPERAEAERLAREEAQHALDEEPEAQHALDEEPEAETPEAETPEDQATPEAPEDEDEGVVEGQGDAPPTVAQMIFKLDQDISELDREKNALTGEIKKLQLQRDHYQTKAFASNTADADMQARLDFIKSQNELRAVRYARGRNIMKLIGKENLDPRCQLDRAMARKTARGTQRPRLRKPRR